MIPRLLAILLCLILLGSLRPSHLFAADGIQTSGDILAIALPATAAGMTALLRDWKGTLQLGESEALTFGATYGLKYGVNERRPNGGTQSFPSGHTSVSFSAAEFLRERYGWEYGIPAYAVASFVAYSRVESHEHYAHDVIAGAGIGILSSYLFTDTYKGWKPVVSGDAHSFGLQLSPAFGKHEDRRSNTMTNTKFEEQLIKVPAVTLGFWLIKIAATTLGETGGDAVSMSMQLGYLLSTGIFTVLFAVAVTAQLSAKRYYPFLYWATIIATTTDRKSTRLNSSH